MPHEFLLSELAYWLARWENAVSTGLAISAIGLLYLKFSGNADEIDPVIEFRLRFDSWYDRYIHGPLDRCFRRLGLSDRVKAALTTVAYGGFVCLTAVIIEVTGLALATGTVIASYQLGTPLSLAPLFESVVLLVLAMTIILMYHGNRRTKENYACA